MRLRRLTIDGFAQLQHVDVVFRDEAPNIIFGPNEAGKSQLMRAFFGMFFPIEHPERLVPWAGEPVMRGSLEFVDSAGHLVQLDRDFNGTDAWISVDGQEPWKGKVKGSTPDAERFAACLESWLGFRDKELFTGTTFVRQADVIMQEKTEGRRSLASQVKELITGTQETSYDQVLKDLQKQRDILRRKPRALKDREIEEKQAELTQLRELFAAAEHGHDRYSQLESQLADCERSLREKKAECDTIEQRLRDASTLIELEKRLGEINSDFEKIDRNKRRLAELQDGLKAAISQCQALSAFETVDEAALTNLQRDLDEAEEKTRQLSPANSVDEPQLSRLDAAVRHAEQAVSELPPWPLDVPIELIRETNREPNALAEPASRQRKARGLNWLAVLVVAAAGIILGVMVHPVFLILVAAAGLYGGAQYLSPHRGTDPQTARQPDRARLAGLLARVGVRNVAEAESRWQQRKEAMAHLDRARENLETLLRHLGVATVDQAYDALLRYRQAGETLD